MEVSFPRALYPESKPPVKIIVANHYLQKRWDAGCHNGVQLWREIHALGFPGTRRMVSNWVVLRRELALERPSAYGRHSVLPKEPAVRLLPAAAAGVGYPLPGPPAAGLGPFAF